MFVINGKKLFIKRYSNGELDMRDFKDNFSEKEFKNGSNVRLSWYYRGSEDLMILMFVKKFFDEKRYNVKLTIKYLPYSRMDRVEDSPFTLKYLCDFINNLNFTEVIVVEAHSDVSIALLNNVSNYLINEDLIKNVMYNVNFDVSKDFVMFPDGGAQKRYKYMKYNTVVGNKVRNFKTDKIESLDVVGDFEKGRKVIIVDDLSSYGNTFIKSAKKLKEMGASEVYLLVAHSEDNIFKGDLLDNDFIDKVFTTNSILTEHKSKDNKLKYRDKLCVYNI